LDFAPGSVQNRNLRYCLLSLATRLGNKRTVSRVFNNGALVQITAKITIGITLLAVNTVAQQREQERFVPANDIAFSIAVGRNSYQVGQEITINYRIMNISNHALYVPKQWWGACPPKPHIWAWFESSSGQHYMPGYGGDCFPKPETTAERLATGARLLKPGQHVTGAISLATNLFGGLRPGTYRIEAVLYGWKEEDFQASDFANMRAPLVRGEMPASTSVRLTD